MKPGERGARGGSGGNDDGGDGGSGGSEGVSGGGPEGARAAADSAPALLTFTGGADGGAGSLGGGGGGSGGSGGSGAMSGATNPPGVCGGLGALGGDGGCGGGCGGGEGGGGEGGGEGQGGPSAISGRVPQKSPSLYPVIRARPCHDTPSSSERAIMTLDMREPLVLPCRTQRVFTSTAVESVTATHALAAAAQVTQAVIASWSKALATGPSGSSQPLDEIALTCSAPPVPGPPAV